jgi:hypothetical protein
VRETWVTPILESVPRSGKRPRLPSSCSFGTLIQESGLPACDLWCMKLG